MNLACIIVIKCYLIRYESGDSFYLSLVTYSRNARAVILILSYLQRTERKAAIAIKYLMQGVYCYALREHKHPVWSR